MLEALKAHLRQNAMGMCHFQSSSNEMVELVQGSEGKMLPVARSAEDAKVMLEALEAGTDGVVLATDDPSQVVRQTLSHPNPSVDDPLIRRVQMTQCPTCGTDSISVSVKTSCSKGI
jgi:3-dehydroquinate synthase class II